MSILKTLICLTLLNLTFSSLAMDEGGDDSGNGGFAYKQSIKILKEASEKLIPLIQYTTYPDVYHYPQRKQILLEALSYNNLEQLPKQDEYRGDRLLAMDYETNPPKVKLYKAFYQSFAGTPDANFFAAVKEVQKRLLHEASHIWGFNEVLSEEFSINFLQHRANTQNMPSDRDDVLVKHDYCICHHGQSIGLGNCSLFCNKNMTSEPILFAEFELSQNDQQRNGLSDLRSWCLFEIIASPHTSPQCHINVEDQNGNVGQLHISSITNNQIQVNLSPLIPNMTYRLNLQSTTNAKSNLFQIRLIESPSPNPVGPLWLDHLNSYQCRFRDQHRDIFTSFKTYFYPNSMRPTAIDNNPDIYCHDKSIYGENDNETYPRLALNQEELSVWSKWDPHFFDIDLNNKLDVHDEIEQLLQSRYGINSNVDIFRRLNANIGYNEGQLFVGYYMDMILDKYNFDYKCPTQADYYGNDPLFRVLRDIMAVDTEKVYTARSTTFNDDEDELILSESKLEKVWFIIKGNKIVKPNKKEINTETVYFYWPMDLKSPYRKKPEQKTFKLFKNQPNKNYEIAFGCVPKI